MASCASIRVLQKCPTHHSWPFIVEDVFEAMVAIYPDCSRTALSESVEPFCSGRDSISLGTDCDDRNEPSPHSTTPAVIVASKTACAGMLPW